MLTSVSGIGSKTALEVLSTLSPEQIAISIASGDYKTLTRAKGIGQKQAQRVVLELKDKVAKLGAPDITLSAPSSFSGINTAKNKSDAVGALMVLGC